MAAVDAYLEEILGPVTSGAEGPVFVVFTSDHGEGLGDHGELFHGIFAYESTLRVPLVVWGPGIEPGTDDRLARHVDLLPTVLAAVGVDAPGGLPGRSLLAAPVTEEPSYFEALTGNLSRGWAPLRGLIDGARKAIELPVPELYDLAADPAETRNLAAAEPRAAAELLGRLPAESAWPPARGLVSPDEEAALRSLGYLGGNAPARQSYGPEDDPKNLIELDRKLHRMNDLYGSGQLAAAVELGERVVAERPTMPLGYVYLSQALLKQGRLGRAIEVMTRARELGAASDTLLRQLGLSLTSAGRPSEAVELLEPLAERGEPATLTVLAVALTQAGRAADAIGVLERVFEADPTNSRAYENLSLAALSLRRWAEARSHAERALELDDNLPGAWNNLGIARYYLGDGRLALEAWERAIALDPLQFDTLFNLGVKAAELGERALARQALERFLANAPPARYAAELELARRTLDG